MGGAGPLAGAAPGPTAGSPGVTYAPGASPPGAFRCPSGPFPAPLDAAATPQRIAGLPPLDEFNASGATRTNLEGPVWVGDALYVSEFPSIAASPPSRVLKLDAAGAANVSELA